VDGQELPETGQVHGAWVAEQRKWARGWRRIVYPALFMVYLIQVAAAIPDDTRGSAGRVAGFAILAVFAACYLFGVASAWQDQPRLYWSLMAVLSALCLAELAFARADALVMGVFISSLVVLRASWWSVFTVLGFTLLAIFLPAAIPSWHDSFSTGLNNGTVIAIPFAGLAMFGFSRVIYGNFALAEARVEIARLAAENERTRIARDLHDLLGHSLTTIVVKAELAQRLAGHDLDAATQEIGEVAALSRRALADVRAAVANYHEVTLAGELATGRELLRAAGIAAELPPAADVVDDKTQELFGWVVREGLTNVVRHSRATTCRVEVSPSAVEIIDDGVGGSRCSGSGLSGLTGRVTSAGGVIEAGPAERGGWRLAVRLTDGASA
jgi:two-component system, NarL family, sensor histidine kinase DesK